MRMVAFAGSQRVESWMTSAWLPIPPRSSTRWLGRTPLTGTTTSSSRASASGWREWRWWGGLWRWPPRWAPGELQTLTGQGWTPMHKCQVWGVWWENSERKSEDSQICQVTKVWSQLIWAHWNPSQPVWIHRDPCLESARLPIGIGRSQIENWKQKNRLNFLSCTIFFWHLKTNWEERFETCCP